MARINLLPWRVERRKLRQKDFMGMLALAVAAGVLASFLVVGWYNGRISNQNSRNEYLQGEISKVDTQIKEIEELREALELDAMELESAKDLVRHAKMRTEQDLDEVLRLLEDRGKPMMKETT